jgi:uncharacterized OB-fold protein
MEYKLKYKQFAEALKENKLLGLKCNRCGAYTVPPKMVCIECGSNDSGIVELSGRGTIRTFTVIRVAPDGFQAPYVVAEAELEEGPWLMGNMIGVDTNEATMGIIGKRVRVGHYIFPGDKFSCGEVVVPAFELTG